MPPQGDAGTTGASRLTTYYFKAGGEGPVCDSVMLCEMIGDVIQSVSLRVSGQSMSQLAKPE